VPSIVLAPSPELGLVVGSGRTVAGFDLAEALDQFRGFFKRFGGHAQAMGLTMPIGQIGAFATEFSSFVEGLKLDRKREIREDGELVLAKAGKHFDEQLALFEPFGEGTRPLFSSCARSRSSASRTGGCGLGKGGLASKPSAGILLPKLACAEAA